MKSIKIALVAVFAAFVALNATSKNMFDILPKTVVHMTIEKAMQYPELVVEMYNQLDPDMLNTSGVTIIGVVEYHNTICYISGTRAQWTLFFSKKLFNEANHKAIKIKTN